MISHIVFLVGTSNSWETVKKMAFWESMDLDRIDEFWVNISHIWTVSEVAAA